VSLDRLKAGPPHAVAETCAETSGKETIEDIRRVSTLSPDGSVGACQGHGRTGTAPGDSPASSSPWGLPLVGSALMAIGWRARSAQPPSIELTNLRYRSAGGGGRIQHAARAGRRSTVCR